LALAVLAVRAAERLVAPLHLCTALLRYLGVVAVAVDLIIHHLVGMVLVAL
jgi:hypothetical protein